MMSTPKSAQAPLTYCFGAGPQRIVFLRETARAMRRDLGESAVLETSAVDLGRDFARSVRNGELDAWDVRMESLRGLVLHDVETLVGLDRTQEELVLRLDGLRRRGGSAVLGSHDQPAALGFSPALMARMEMGVIEEVSR